MRSHFSFCIENWNALKLQSSEFKKNFEKHCTCFACGQRLFQFWNCSISRIILAQISVSSVNRNDTWYVQYTYMLFRKTQTHSLAGTPILLPQIEYILLVAKPLWRWISDYVFGNSTAVEKVRASSWFSFWDNRFEIYTVTMLENSKINLDNLSCQHFCIVFSIFIKEAPRELRRTFAK